MVLGYKTRYDDDSRIMVMVSSSSSYFLFGIVYEKQNVQTLKQAWLTSSNTKGNNKIISRLYHVQACRSFP